MCCKYRSVHTMYLAAALIFFSSSLAAGNPLILIYGWNSKYSGTPKWMVKIMEIPMNKWVIWGYHYFRKPPYLNRKYICTVRQCFQEVLLHPGVTRQSLQLSRLSGLWHSSLPVLPEVFASLKLLKLDTQVFTHKNFPRTNITKRNQLISILPSP